SDFARGAEPPGIPRDWWLRLGCLASVRVGSVGLGLWSAACRPSAAFAGAGLAICPWGPAPPDPPRLVVADGLSRFSPRRVRWFGALIGCLASVRATLMRREPRTRLSSPPSLPHQPRTSQTLVDHDRAGGERCSAAIRRRGDVAHIVGAA